MARPRKIDNKLVGKAKEIFSFSEDITELRKVQSILLPAMMGATLNETATILGVSRATVLVCNIVFAKIIRWKTHQNEIGVEGVVT